VFAAAADRRVLAGDRQIDRRGLERFHTARSLPAACHANCADSRRRGPRALSTLAALGSGAPRLDGLRDRPKVGGQEVPAWIPLRLCPPRCRSPRRRPRCATSCSARRSPPTPTSSGSSRRAAPATPTASTSSATAG
jgi:hypothetical protein